MPRRIGMGTALAGRLAAPKAQTERTTVRIPPELKKAMLARIVEDNYGLRGKSRWIQEAIETFLDRRTWEAMGVDGERGWMRYLLEVSAVPEGKAVVEAVNLTEALRTRLWHAALEAMLFGAKLEEPLLLELNRSSVVRAAISFRLLREETFAATVAANDK